MKKTAAGIVLITLIMLAGCMPREAIMPESIGDSGSFEPMPESTELYDVTQPMSLEDSMIEMIERYEPVFVFDNMDENEIIDTYLHIIGTRKDFFWLTGSYSYVKKTVGDRFTVELTPVMTESAADIPAMRLDFAGAAEKVLAMAKEYGTDYERALFVHDYLIDHTAYDVLSAEQAEADPTGTGARASNAYGCLVDGLAVCSGYAAAYNYLMYELSIPCGNVTGSKIGGESHEWNYIMLDGEAYYVDVTWDDPIMTDGTERDNKTHEFFCITSAELLKTHVIDEDCIAPDCTATAYDYYRQSGTYMEYFDFDTFAAIFAAVGGRDVTVKFPDPQCVEQAIGVLFTNQRIRELTSGTAFTYGTGAAGCMLHIEVS